MKMVTFISTSISISTISNFNQSSRVCWKDLHASRRSKSSSKDHEEVADKV